MLLPAIRPPTDDDTCYEMRFIKTQVDALVAALPGCTDARRRSLLRRIFKEWGRIDLEEHLTRSTPKQIRARRRQIHKVASRARGLARALTELESAGRFAIANKQLEMGTGSRNAPPSYEGSQGAHRRLSEEPSRLAALAEAATEASKACVPLPLRQSTVVRYLVLLDLAAIYEWATRQGAGRRVKTDMGDDAGKTYGPFWNFVSAAWPIIFGSVAGLDSALRTWAKGVKRYKEASAIIWNLDLRHPEWRIRETNRSQSAIRHR